MKTKADGIPKAFEPYKQEEVDLILSLIPTHTNVKRLSKALGRTDDAIYTVYELAYSGRWLKKELGIMDEGQDNIVTKTVKTKRKLGLFIGHNPKE